MECIMTGVFRKSSRYILSRLERLLLRIFMRIPWGDGDQGSTRKVKEAYIYLTLPEGKVNGPAAGYQTPERHISKGSLAGAEGVFHA
jgi:hypothetical protein